MTHELKTWPGPFEDVLRELKTFEVRNYDDRRFRVGDTLLLREWDPNTLLYTGREVRREVTYILYGGLFGIPPELCVMSIVPIE